MQEHRFERASSVVVPQLLRRRRSPQSGDGEVHPPREGRAVPSGRGTGHHRGLTTGREAPRGTADVRAVHAGREDTRARGALRSGGLAAGHRMGGALERRADSSLPRLPPRRCGAAGPVPSAPGPGAVVGAGPGDREPARQRAGRDRAREARVPCGVPTPALPRAGERLARVAPHAGGEGAILDQPRGRTRVQPRGAVGGVGRGRVPHGDLFPTARWPFPPCTSGAGEARRRGVAGPAPGRAEDGGAR